MRVLEKNIINLYGDKGKQWLASLPDLIEQTKIAYGLSKLKPIINLSYNYVLSGFQESQPIILKLGPDSAGSKREASALKAFAGFGVVKVLKESEGMLLIERAISGTSLKSYFPKQDNDAIQITCDCLKRLHQAPIPHAHVFPQIKEWLIALDKDLNIPAHYLHQARQLRDDLLATPSESVLLHGDLHHDNMLQNGDGWIVIDPKGVIGEPAYELAAFIRNPIPELLAQKNAANIISQRIARFAAILELPEQRILDWCFVQAVLAWVWAIEDSCDESYFKQLTEFFWKFTDDQP
ncbi:TPA: aminoglycoside phosphotransferase family protein [Legionella pneumophila]